MSFRECVQVSKIVFGPANEPMWKHFLSIISPHMVGQKTDTTDSRRIDIAQFLHLAVVGYHQTQPHDGNQAGRGTSIVVERDFVPEEDYGQGGEYDDLAVAPSDPRGGMYLSQYNPDGRPTKLTEEAEDWLRAGRQRATGTGPGGRPNLQSLVPGLDEDVHGEEYSSK